MTAKSFPRVPSGLLCITASQRQQQIWNESHPSNALSVCCCDQTNTFTHFTSVTDCFNGLFLKDVMTLTQCLPVIYHCVPIKVKNTHVLLFMAVILVVVEMFHSLQRQHVSLFYFVCGGGGRLKWRIVGNVVASKPRCLCSVILTNNGLK